jgi:diguanylate cyclase (GGDEF)-like protein
VLFREGDEGREMFVVEKGKLGVTVKTEDGSDLDIAEFGPGDFFGEMSIFEHEARSATCYTKSPSTLLSLHENELLSLIDKNPTTATKILLRMLEITRDRLDNTGSFLSDMVQWGEAARKRSITDELTGFYNRRFLDESLPTLVKEAADAGKPLAICMLDLDHFRTINEEISHEVGDLAIQSAVSVLKEVLLPDDIAIRYGGDEFVLIMPETTADDAAERAQKVCSKVSKLDILRKYDCSVKSVTTSIGVACLPIHGKTSEELSDAADKALYQAKESGRNRVVMLPGGAS